MLGSYSTSSMRLPYRSCVWSTGGVAGGAGGERPAGHVAAGAAEARGASLDVLLGRSAGFDPLAQQPGEHVAMAAPRGEALGRGRWIDRLGTLGIRQHRPRQRAP